MITFLTVLWFVSGLLGLYLGFVLSKDKPNFDEFKPIYVWWVLTGPVVLLSVIITEATEGD